MAKKKYKKKPESWYCIQYTGSNVAEMTEFCPLLTYNSVEDKLILAGLVEVHPTDWVMEDISGAFQAMVNSQFNAFFSLDSAE